MQIIQSKICGIAEIIKIRDNNLDVIKTVYPSCKISFISIIICLLGLAVCIVAEYFYKEPLLSFSLG